MARSRNIKPSIFKNEILGEADPLVTVVFIGLWCLADRSGRLEDRPKRIKAELLPYRECPDFNGYLTVLERLGFIRRYTVENQAIIQVVNFAKHQSPHKTERPSELPEEPEESASCASTVKAPLSNESATVKESLIPDSLIPDSLCGKKPRKRATPATSAFEITPDLEQWSKAETPGVDLKAETVKFLDHHRAKGNSFKDWDSAWRNWMRKAVEFRREKGGAPPDPAALPRGHPLHMKAEQYEALDEGGKREAWQQWQKIHEQRKAQAASH